MLKAIRNKRVAGKVAIFLMLIFLTELFSPTVALALTGGPSQPEVQSFEPVGTTEMVDNFSGDFVYNIPLLDVGGYPINISYHSGVSMDEEASWTGLGWNINPGAITRSVRGMPDDFNGTETVTKDLNMKNNATFGVKLGVGLELVGLDASSFGLDISFGLGVNYNNYIGVGIEQSFGINVGLKLGSSNAGVLNGGLGITSSGGDGLTISPSIGYSTKLKKNEKSETTLGASIGTSFNSRSGLKELTVSKSVSHTQKKDVSKMKAGNNSGGMGVGYRNSSSVSFVASTYSPNVDMSMLNYSITVKANIGAHIWGLDGSIDIMGHFSEQKLMDKHISSPAYGYLYTDNAIDQVTGAAREDALLDFNREKDGSFNKNTPALPLTNLTYDILSVAAQGAGGTIRPFRGDVGYIYDAHSRNLSVSASLGVEVDGANTVHVGVDINVNTVNTNSGLWQDDNDLRTNMGFRTKDNNNKLYEPYYFKEVGEKSVSSDQGLYNRFGQGKAVRVGLADAGLFNTKATSQFVDDAGSSYPINSNNKNYRNARDKRNQAITYLNFAEASRFGLQTSLYTGTNHPAHHIAEITVLRTDGSRYVYGLPAYNKSQQEVTFNVTGNSFNCNNGLVDYSGGNDNSVDNDNAVDHFYSRVTTPAFAHSYLLTAVVSPDYVDVTGNGPSEDDLGTYTKFSYTNATSGGDYQWRVPAELNKANFNEGLKPINTDNKGSYLYGTKEIWYLRKIETKTHVGVFDLNPDTQPRKDGFGVTGENGGISTSNKSHRLEKISLYSKPDYDANQQNATPIKTVNFEYDYSLCPSIPNAINSAGKLTLKKIFFTYGKSYKGRFSPYEFTYSNFNPSYNLKGYDRWGNFMPNNGGCGISDPLPTSEYPYTDQTVIPSNNQHYDASDPTRTFADLYAKAWSLEQVKLPSGGVIKVHYESDDYAYVQDKQANQMFKIIGVNDHVPTSANDLGGNNLYDGINDPNLYLVFELPEVISGQNADQIFREKYLNQQIANNMYFRFLVDLTDDSKYEYIPGYTTIDASSSGVVAGTRIGYVKLNQTTVGDNGGQANPIAKAAWQFGRIHTSRLVWDQPTIGESTSVLDVLMMLTGADLFTNIIQTFAGPNGMLQLKGYGKQIALGKSWIRLLSPDKKKQGGGSRVKKIEVSDEWGSLLGDPSRNFSYGQEYDYTTVENNKVISSGVASYEPQLGGDESPFRQPVAYSMSNKLVPDDSFYMEEPFGESFFPSPSVGYSKVTVRNLRHANVKRHATGKVVHEFYTAKDFPTIVDRTELKKEPKKSNNLATALLLVPINSVDYMTASQGFSIELNDMHGKPKSQRVYAEEQNPADPLEETLISYIEYHYKKVPYKDNFRLENTVRTLKKYDAGNIFVEDKQVGVEFDAVADFRENRTNVISAGASGNVSVSYIPPVIISIIPTIFPSFLNEKTRFRSASFTKVIYKYGILEKTVAFDLGSRVETNNLAYDAETGELLLTKTINNYDDHLYSFTYPAHWGYDRMGPAYQNIGLKLDFGNSGPGVQDQSALFGANYLVPGDEVIAKYGGGILSKKAWVWDNDESTPNTIYFIDAAGAIIPYPNTIKVIRSGRRNQQSLAIGNIVSKSNPISGNTLSFEDQAHAGKNVITGEAVEFSEKWGMFCGFKTSSRVDCDSLPVYYDILRVGGDYFNCIKAAPGGVQYNIYIGSPNQPSGTWTQVCSSSSPQFSTPIFSGNYFLEIIFPNGCKGYSQMREGHVWDIVKYDGNGDNILDGYTCNNIPPGATYTSVGINNMVEPGSNPNGTICGNLDGDNINPYVKGIRGNWRAQKTYKYLSERSSSILDIVNTGKNTNVREDGTLLTRNISNGNLIEFQPFWKLPTGVNANPFHNWKPDPQYWTWTTEITKYSPSGVELENKDALNRFSAALFGYHETLPVAVASNAAYTEIAFDNFEDYRFNNSSGCSTHFSFYDPTRPDGQIRTMDEAHSGKYSYFLAAGQTASIVKEIISPICSTGVIGTTAPYVLNQCECIGYFSPTYTVSNEGKYVLSVWVKQNTPLYAPVFDYPGARVNVYLNNNLVTPVSLTRSDIIEGWQRIEMMFNIPAFSNSIKVEFVSSAHTSYFDDIRIHPYHSTMKSFVYDPVSLRYVAQLDENNYATFYEYDEEGILSRVKVETERGIVTVQETKTNSVKTP